MTDIAKTAPATETTLAIRLWRWFIKPRSKAQPSQNLPRSGQPITQEVVTKLSIRAGFTAGPW